MCRFFEKERELPQCHFSDIAEAAAVSAGSAGAHSIGYGLWLMRLQPFEGGLQRQSLG